MPLTLPFELRKISHMAKTYNLREIAPVENHYKKALLSQGNRTLLEQYQQGF